MAERLQRNILNTNVIRTEKSHLAKICTKMTKIMKNFKSAAKP